MDDSRNPYAPGAGRRPVAIAGRDPEIASFRWPRTLALGPWSGTLARHWLTERGSSPTSEMLSRTGW